MSDIESIKENILKFIDSIPKSIENLETTIGQLFSNSDDIEEQIDAVKDGVCNKAAEELRNYLENEKVPYFQDLGYSEAAVTFEEEFNTVGYQNQLDAWSIFLDATTTYSFTINWDNDAFITQWMNDWDTANDFLTRLLTSGATYGLIPYQDHITAASEILTTNKNKLTSMLDIFNRYLPFNIQE
jgi:hypothetical protein